METLACAPTRRATFRVATTRPTQFIDLTSRLEALVETTDGFELAEVDLELRGEGQLLGTRQSGLSDLRFTKLRADRPLLEKARAAAQELIDVEGPLDDEVERAFVDRVAAA